MEVVAHHCPCVNAAGKNIPQLQNTGFDPGFPMLEALAEVFVQATKPRSAHAAIHAMKSARLSWVNKLAAGLGHGRSVGARALRKDRIGCNLELDLSEGCLRSATNRSVLDQKHSNDDEKPNRTNLIAARRHFEHCASRTGRLRAPLLLRDARLRPKRDASLKNRAKTEQKQSKNRAKTEKNTCGEVWVHICPRRFSTQVRPRRFDKGDLAQTRPQLAVGALEFSTREVIEADPI